MSSGNVFERLFKLWASICKLVIDGKRDAEEVCRLLQTIVDGKDGTALQSLLADWTVFYKDVFGLELDFSELKIPERKLGFDRLLVVAQGMTPQRLFDKCKELFPSRKYTDVNLDEKIKSDRSAKDRAYAVWVRDRVEADEENKNLSANQLKKRDTAEITLEERELFELKFFKETGKHLDMENLTLCAGSRDSGGRVPSVYFDSGYDGVRVGWFFPDYACDSLRSRSVVSDVSCLRSEA